MSVGWEGRGWGVDREKEGDEDRKGTEGRRESGRRGVGKIKEGKRGKGRGGRKNGGREGREKK